MLFSWPWCQLPNLSFYIHLAQSAPRSTRLCYIIISVRQFLLFISAFLLSTNTHTHTYKQPTIQGTAGAAPNANFARAVRSNVIIKMISSPHRRRVEGGAGRLFMCRRHKSAKNIPPPPPPAGRVRVYSYCIISPQPWRLCLQITQFVWTVQGAPPSSLSLSLSLSLGDLLTKFLGREIDPPAIWHGLE